MDHPKTYTLLKRNQLTRTV